ncbi:endonuclease/exonuclease/phosphatase family protein, partial [Georgenia sp. 10Sc9-8]|nr:endonuclease/exonuclease/phosphatase family protein [Georgenia halotolerans]
MSAAPLRVLTLNLQHGRPAATQDPAAQDGPGALLAATRQITALDPDLVLLQEVDRRQARSGGTDQAAVLAGGLGLSSARFAPAFAGPVQGLHRRPRRSDDQAVPGYGVALLSRHPVRSWHVRRLRRARPRLRRGRVLPWSLRPDEARVLLVARVDAPGGMLTVGVTHLSTRPATARDQLQECERALRALPGPYLLGGDLNLEPPAVAAVTSLNPLARALTFTNRRPRRQIDHLLGSATLRPDGPGAAHHLAVSDHAALGVT